MNDHATQEDFLTKSPQSCTYQILNKESLVLRDFRENGTCQANF